MPPLGILKGLRLFKTMRTAKTVSGVAKVGALSKIGVAIKELPVVKIIAGSAAGIVILDMWNDSRSAISETFGISAENSGIVLAVAVAVVIALVISLLRRR